MSQSHKQPPPPCAIVIFGANGDLTRRLIVPALYNLARTQMLPPRFALVGIDHNDKNTQEWRDKLHEFLEQSADKGGEGSLGKIDDALWQPIARAMTFEKGDFEQDKTYADLGKLLAVLLEAVLQLRERGIEVALDVVVERLERGDVEEMDRVGEWRLQSLADERVELDFGALASR